MFTRTYFALFVGELGVPVAFFVTDSEAEQWAAALVDAVHPIDGGQRPPCRAVWITAEVNADIDRLSDAR